MTRRVASAFVGLIVALLAAVVVPLGLETAHQYRADFLDSVLRQAQSLSRVVEEHVSDHRHTSALPGDLAAVHAPGQRSVVLDPSGRPIAQWGGGLPAQVLARAVRVRRPTAISFSDPGHVLVAVPVTDGTSRFGTVVESRSTGPLEDRVRELWTTLVVVALVAIAAAVLLAAWLSRWVSRPLRRLESVLHRVGAGDLEVRADAIRGPAEVRRLAGSFDTMTARLQALVANHRSVVADVSHQLRTPIAALRLRLELLAEQPTPDVAELAGALDEVGRLSRMVDGLLSVAKAEAVSAVPADVDLAGILEERAAAWRPLAVEHEVQLEVRADGPVPALAVLDHVQQVFDNLLANCLATVPLPHRVVLTARRAGDNAVAIVSDDGPGMAPRERAEAFDRFHSGRDGQGTGLGLAIVQRLVTAGGGTIALAETPGGGLTAIVTFPVGRGSTRRPRQAADASSRTGAIGPMRAVPIALSRGKRPFHD